MHLQLDYMKTISILIALISLIPYISVMYLSDTYTDFCGLHSWKLTAVLSGCGLNYFPRYFLHTYFPIQEKQLGHSQTDLDLLDL